MPELMKPGLRIAGELDLQMQDEIRVRALGAEEVVVGDVRLAIAAGEAAVLHAPELRRGALPAGERFAIEERLRALGKRRRLAEGERRKQAGSSRESKRERMGESGRGVPQDNPQGDARVEQICAVLERILRIESTCRRAAGWMRHFIRSAATGRHLEGRRSAYA